MLKNAADVLHRGERLALRSGRDSLFYPLNVDGKNILCWGSQGVTLSTELNRFITRISTEKTAVEVTNQQQCRTSMSKRRENT
jgi:hypothetical protein